MYEDEDDFDENPEDEDGGFIYPVSEADTKIMKVLQSILREFVPAVADVLDGYKIKPDEAILADLEDLADFEIPLLQKAKEGTALIQIRGEVIPVKQIKRVSLESEYSLKTGEETFYIIVNPNIVENMFLSNIRIPYETEEERDYDFQQLKISLQNYKISFVDL